MTRGKLVTGLISLVVILAVLAGADAYVRVRTLKAAGLNRHGYRGSVLGRKGPGEVRIALLGGSIAFGYGVRPDESLAHYVEKGLRELYATPISVVNLAYNAESSICFRPTLEHYSYLEPDIVVIVSGVNDTVHTSTNRKPEDCFRSRDPVFRLTGYMPVLPLAVKEKYYAIRYGSVEEGYKAVQRPFKGAPNKIYTDEEERLAISRYAVLMVSAIDYVVEGGGAVLVVNPPMFYDDPFRLRQQDYLAGRLSEVHGRGDKVLYLDLSGAFSRSVKGDLSFDDMHLTPRGNMALSRLLLPEISRIGRFEK